MLFDTSPIRTFSFSGSSPSGDRLLQLTFWSCVLLALFLQLAASPPLAHAQDDRRALAAAIDDVLDGDDLRHAWWGVHVVDAETGDLLYARNPQRPFMPASNVKMFTTAGALLLFGPEHTFDTSLYAVGDIDDGILRGSLVVQAGGDPTIGGRFFEDNPVHLFDAWYDALSEAGISEVRGELLADLSFFDTTPLGQGWAWDGPPARYSAEVGPLSFRENTFELRYRGGQLGGPATLSWQPSTAYIQIQNESRTVSQNSGFRHRVDREKENNMFVVRSQVPTGNTISRPVSVHNPALYFLHEFRERLQERGLHISREMRTQSEPVLSLSGATSNHIHTHASPPLQKILDEVMVESQNLYAEAVIRSIGAEHHIGNNNRDRGSAAAGAAAILDTLAAIGTDTSNVRLVDGSGLSRRNLATPESLTSLLVAMDRSAPGDVREAFRASFPTAGMNGTLRYRMRQGAASGNVRAKTGTLSHASALSGYVTTLSGRNIAFSVVANHYTVNSSHIRRAQDSIMHILAGYRGR